MTISPPAPALRGQPGIPDEVPDLIADDATGRSGIRSDRWPARGVAGMLLLLTTLSSLIRLEGARMWFWIDEALTVGIASQPLLEIPAVLRMDGSPPLYYLLLHVWSGIFGTGELATHSLSLGFAVACVPVGYVAARTLFDRRAATMTAILAATIPFLTHFARETRMYSLVTFLAMVVSASFVHAFCRRTRNAVPVFALSLTALLYTHNWGIYLVVACALGLLPAAYGSTAPRRVARDGALALAVVVLAYVPWGFVLVGQIGDTGAPWSFTPSARQVVYELAALVRDERVLVLLAAVVGAGLLELWRRPRSSGGAIAWTLSTLVVVPVGLGWVVAHVEPSWATRYLAVIVGPLLLLLGWGLARAGTAGAIALVLAVALWVQPLTRVDGTIRFEPQAKSDAKALASAIDRRLGDGDLVIVAQPEAVPLFAHYVERDVRFATLWGEVDSPELMDWRDGEERLAASSVESNLVPLVRSLPEGARVALVGPGGKVVPTDTEWIRTFHRRHSVWRRTLTAGPETTLIERISDAMGDGTPGRDASDTGQPAAIPFVASIFEVVGSVDGAS